MGSSTEPSVAILSADDGIEWRDGRLFHHAPPLMTEEVKTPDLPPVPELAPVQRKLM
jgi:hypothetical protein